MPAIELERPFGDVVEEVAVVGDHDHGARIVAQMMLEPGDALGVEMVGRLVEQEDVRLGEQQLAERHAPLLAARQLRDIGIARRAAQRVHGLLDLRVEVPQALRVDLVLQLGHLVGGLVGIVHGQLVIAVELRLLLRHAFHDVAGHVLGLIQDRLLRQIADADAIGRPGFADELLLLSGHDAEQSRLAGAVDADHADLGAGQEGERYVLQDLLAARIGLGQLVHDINVLGRGHKRAGAPRICWKDVGAASSQLARPGLNRAIAEQLRQALFKLGGKRIERVLLDRLDLGQRAGEGIRRKVRDRQNAAPAVLHEELAIAPFLVGEAVGGRRHAYGQSRRDGLRDHRARILRAEDHLGFAEYFGQSAGSLRAVIDEAGDDAVILGKLGDLVGDVVRRAARGRDQPARAPCLGDFGDESK